MGEGNAKLAGIDTFIEETRGEFEDMLGALVQVPTISADPAHGSDVRRGAEMAAQYLRAFGAQVEVAETPGNPVVLGKMAGQPGAPTVTVYNHLDVQPAQEPEWVREPFVFHIDQGTYYGRGCTDDKGPALTALFAARYAMEQGIPVNVQFMWETEEEIGSPSFGGFLASRAGDLATQAIVVSDTVWLSRDIPAMPYGLRGLQGARLSLETGERDAHSGLTGGAARNPLGELCQVISRCYDPRTGQVHIPGFSDDVVQASGQEIEGFLASGFDVGVFMKAHGLKSLRSTDPREVIQRIWCLPTFEVHGISGGYQGPGLKTVVPPRAEAKVSMRLVPDQDPEEKFRLLESFVKDINPHVDVQPDGSLRPYLGDFHGPYAEAARKAILFGFSKEPAFIREGGSIGAVVSMKERLGAPITFIGLSLPEHRYHGPNEHYDWGQASGGMKALAAFFAEVASIGT